jgi:TolB-like protein
MTAEDCSSENEQPPSDSVSTIEPGIHIGPYCVGRLLGRGGMGVVYEARDGRLNRQVAIKFLLPERLHAAARQRFRREAQLASSLNHPHILTVYDTGNHAGSPYLVTELVNGGTLEQWLTGKPLPWREVAEFLYGVADALAAAHSANILHRDIKPSNVLLNRSGHAKLADFGLARPANATDSCAGEGALVTRADMLLGTPAYMSPEQISGRGIDARTDIFAFGVVLYELLAGRRPFVGDTAVDIMHAVTHERPAALPPEIPAALRTIAEKAIEKDPNERYQSMRDLAIDLKRILRKTVGDGSNPDAAIDRIRDGERTRGRRWAAAVASSVLLAAAAGAYVAWDRSGTKATAAQPAVPAIQRSLAVLPFANLSPEADHVYFAEGVGVEILNVLSRVPDLRVTGRISSAYFKGRGDPLPTIAETLGVDHLLTGSVRRAGDRVRITVELVDTASGYQLWSESYERQFGDILEVQDEIASRVATALQVKLGLGDNAEIGMTRNVAAYDEFLRGVWQFDAFTPQSLLLAIKHMHRAIALDPTFARAWAYLYCIYSDGSHIVAESADEWRHKRLEVLERARSLTPESPFVQVLLAREEMRSGKPLAARAAVDALAPGYWTSDRYVTRDVFQGKFAIGTGHTTAALEALERARAVDPLSPVVAFSLSIAHASAGDPKASLAANDRAIELRGLNPRFAANAILTALGSGDREEIKRRVALLPNDTTGYRAMNEALARHLDNPAAARAEARRLAQEAWAPSDFRSVMLAHWAAYYGEAELALELLSGTGRAPVDELLLWRPVLGNMRALPAFKELVRREGLVDYWRVHGWPDLCQPTSNDDFECH